MPIQKLPPEILADVFTYIWRPSDLKNICLTCRVLQDHAVSILYKDVHLKLGTGTSVWTSYTVEDNAISNFQYTQSLTVSAANSSVGKRKHTVYKDFMTVMDLIPIDQLKKFKWSIGDRDTAPIRATEFRYLFKKQQKLQELRGCIMAGFDLALHALDTPTEIFQSHSLRHLSVHLRSADTWWSTLWQSFPKLDSFELEVRDVYIPGSVTDWVSPDLNTPVARASYSLAPKPAPLQLKRLAVRVPARYAPSFNGYAAIVPLIFESFDLSMLDHLTLENFSGTDGILYKMMETYKGQIPPITYIELIGIEREYNLWAVSNLLAQFLGLKTLKLAFRWREFRDKNCMLIPHICSHSLTLQTLFMSVQYSTLDNAVDYWISTTTGVLPDTMMEILLSTCRNLEYLCLPGPCRRLACSTHAVKVLNRFTSHTDNLPYLRTLALSNLPCKHIDPHIPVPPPPNPPTTTTTIETTPDPLSNPPSLANPLKTFHAIRAHRADFRTLLLPSPSSSLSSEEMDEEEEKWGDGYEPLVLVGKEPVVVEHLKAVKYVEGGFEEVEEWFVGLGIWEEGREGGGVGGWW